MNGKDVETASLPVKALAKPHAKSLSAASPLQRVNIQASSAPSPKSDAEAAFEGDTSLLAHSLHAQGLFENLTSFTSSGRSK